MDSIWVRQRGMMQLDSVTPHKTTVLPLKITVSRETTSLPPPPPPPFLPRFPSVESSLQQTSLNNAPVIGSYWSNTQQQQQLYVPFTNIMNNQNHYCDSYNCDMGVLHKNPITTRQPYFVPKSYTHLIDPPPPPPELGVQTNQTSVPYQHTYVDSESNIRRDGDGTVQNEQQMIRSNFHTQSGQQISKREAGWMSEREEQAASENPLTKRSHFKGKVYQLPENSGRPQSSEGRTFPLKFREDLNYDSSDYNEDYRGSPVSPRRFPSLKYAIHTDQAPALIRTATKIVRKVVHPVQKALITAQTTSKSDASLLTPNPAITASSVDSLDGMLAGPSNLDIMMTSKIPKPMKRIASSGTLSRNGMSWRRRRTAEHLEEQIAPTKTFRFEEQKINRRLRRIKDKLYTDSSHECFEFAEHGQCFAGIFCPFDHNGDSTHRTTKICERLMLGLCRGSCGQCHNLGAHQMPVCDYFLRFICSDEHCPYLHVKHADGSKRCEDFNRGICKKGDCCPFPHRYHFSVIRKKCDVLQTTEHRDEAIQSAGSEGESGTDGKCVLEWML